MATPFDSVISDLSELNEYEYVVVESSDQVLIIEASSEVQVPLSVTPKFPSELVSVKLWSALNVLLTVTPSILVSHEPIIGFTIEPRKLQLPNTKTTVSANKIPVILFIFFSY